MNKSLGICAALLGLLMLGAFALREEIMTLIFSENYREAALAFALLMLSFLLHALSEEMAVKLTDVVMRRTDLGSHQRPSEIELSDIADQMASVLQWSENRCVSELTECRDRYPFMYN